MSGVLPRSLECTIDQRVTVGSERDSPIEGDAVEERERADVSSILRDERPVEDADTRLSDIVDARRRSNDHVTEVRRHRAWVGRRRIVAVECARRRRSVRVEDLPERLVGLEDAWTTRRDRL